MIVEQRPGTRRGTRMLRRASAPALPLLAAVMVGTSACGDASTGPVKRPALSVAFLDAEGRLNTARSGEERVVTAVMAGIPYAATGGAVALAGVNGLQLYHLGDGTLDTLPVAQFGYRTAGAISPDGQRLAYAARVTGTAAGVYLVTLHLASGTADSVRVSGRDDAPAAEQIEFSTPIYSPSGDSIAFLLPNFLGMQLFLYEVRTGRLEVHPVPVQVSTYFEPLPGWPRWASDATIRFLTRRRINGVLTDTLVVLEIYPREPEMYARAVFQGAPPAGTHLSSAGTYSFDARGEAVAFAMTSGAQTGVFAFRRGQPTFETLVLEDGFVPRYPILVP